MNKPIIAISAAALLLGSVALAMAQNRGGTSEPSPGHQMQDEGSVKGQPGASGYAPGHDRDDLKGGTGHQELRDRDDRTMTRDRDDRSMSRDRDDSRTLRDKDDRGTLGGGTMDRDRK